MERSEATGIGLAVFGHVLLFGALSLGWMTRSTPLVLSDPVEVQLVDDIGLHSAQPKVATEEPAPSAASEIAPPTPAAAPTPTKAVSKPADETPALTPATKPKPSHLARDLALAGAATATVTPKGRQLGAHFLDGISDKPSTSTSMTPRAATISAHAQASYRDAITQIVQPCLSEIPYIGPGAENIHTNIVLHLNPDGSLSARPDAMQTGITDENRPNASRLKELAIRAYQKCAPYQLPPNLYRDGAGHGWNTVLFQYTWKKS